MLSLRPIVNIATPEFLLAWRLYEEAFPVDERRSLEQQIQLLKNPAYQFLSIHHEEEFAGLLGIWHLPGTSFLEHFAVQPHLRGKGIGATSIQILLEELKQAVVLEVELPQTDSAKRRINFYERLGFHLSTFAYQQPPYDAGKPWVSLWLMSYPKALDQQTFESLKGQLYAQVYQQQQGS